MLQIAQEKCLETNNDSTSLTKIMNGLVSLPILRDQCVGWLVNACISTLLIGKSYNGIQMNLIRKGWVDKYLVKIEDPSFIEASRIRTADRLAAAIEVAEEQRLIDTVAETEAVHHESQLPHVKSRKSKSGKSRAGVSTFIY